MCVCVWWGLGFLWGGGGRGACARGLIRRRLCVSYLMSAAAVSLGMRLLVWLGEGCTLLAET